MLIKDELIRLNEIQNKANTAEEIQGLISEYSALLNAVPEDPVILFFLGTANLQYGYNGVAIQLLKRALSYQPVFPEAWNNIGSAWKAENIAEKALPCFLKAIDQVGDDSTMKSDYFNNIGTLYINGGDPDLGLPYLEQAVELNPDNVKAHWNMALLLLEKGEWLRGFQEMDSGLLSGDRPLRFYSNDLKAIPWYEGQEDDKKIIVYGEQGMGDEVMFLSCLQEFIDDVGADRVIYDCHPRMEDLFRRSFPDIEIIPTRKALELEWPQDRDDLGYKIAVGSLMRLYRSEGKFPKDIYLKPDPERVKEYKEWLSHFPGPYIGVGYAGGSKKTSGHERSYKLNDLKPILELPATFVSLQYTEGAKEKWDRFYNDTGIRVHHWDEVVRARNYDESVALMAALDAVVVPNTTAVHVCGAIGQTCLTFTPKAKAWRYCGAGDEMVFYGPWVQQYHEVDGKEDQIQRLAKDLKVFVRNKRAAA